MVMSKQQAAQIVAELDVEEQFETALNEFVKQGGEDVAPYFSGNAAYENGKKIAEWGIANLPYGVQSLTKSSGFEIAFRNCKAILVPDPDWRSASEIYKDLEVRLTASQFKAICTGKDATLAAELAASLEKLGGAEIFRRYAEGERR